MLSTLGPRALRLLPLLVLAYGVAPAQQSAGYRIESLEVSILAGRATSAGYVNAATAVTIGGASGVCPAGATATFGFWSVLGAREVPVLLAAGRSPLQPASVRLVWSGRAREFTVYRSSDPTDVTAPANVLGTTTLCKQADSPGGAADLLFYKVEPGAP